MSKWLRQRRIRTAAAGYAVVALFGIGFGVARAVGTSAGNAAIVGFLLAAPVVIALIGERITSVKGFGFEVSLINDAAVPIAGDKTKVAGNLSEMGMRPILSSSITTSNFNSSGVGSAPGNLSEQFRSLIEARSRLLRIDLRTDDYWWSTRLFLVAALAQDYTDVQAMVFVHDGADVFVGIDSPGAVRKSLAANFSRFQYEAAYTYARANALTATPDLEDLRMPESAVRAVAAVLGGWQDALHGLNQVEVSAMQIVSSVALRGWLRDTLDTRSVRDGPVTEGLLHRIISHESRYVALTDNSRLKRVIDRDELALQIISEQLELRMGPYRIA